MKPEFKLKIIFDYYVELTHFLKAYSEENATKLNNSILTKLNHEWNKENLLQCLKSTWACEKAKKEIESHFYMEINQNNIELIEKKLKSNKKFKQKIFYFFEQLFPLMPCAKEFINYQLINLEKTQLEQNVMINQIQERRMKI